MMRMLNGLTLLSAMALSIQATQAATYTVSKDGRGAFTTIQAAVNNAGKGDIVEILDAGIYPEQVTIDSNKHGLTLRSANPGAAAKPIIRWTDLVNVGPKTCQEALDTNKITFDHNGALRLILVRNVIIQGIAVDGGVPTAMAYPNVWGNGVTCTGALYPLFLGNAGLLIYGSVNAVVRECDVTGAYFGLYIKNRETDGPYFPAGTGSSEWPFSRLALGNHIIEGSSIHDNSWGVFVENAWGLGSTFRNNLIYQNHHRENQGALVKAMPDGALQPGGAFFFKSVQTSPMAILNNTFAGNFLLLGGGYQAGAQHLIVNNLFASPHIPWSVDPNFTNSFQELSSIFPRRMKHNVFAAQARKPAMDSKTVTAQRYDSAAEVWVEAYPVVHFARTINILNGMPVPDLATPTLDITVPLSTGPVTVPVTLPAGIYPGALIARASEPNHFLPEHGNRWQETGFLSESAADTGFLSPAPDFREALRAGWPGLGYRTASGTDAGVGAVPLAGRIRDLVRVIPLAPVRVVDGQVVLSFSAELVGAPSPTGALLEIAYLRMQAKVPVDPASFGAMPALVLKEAEPLAIPSTAIRYGYNEIRTPLAGPAIDSNGYGFVEMAVRGAGVFSNVASFPILPIATLFKVEALEESTDQPLAKAEVGKTFRIRVSSLITPVNPMPVALFLASGLSLDFPDPPNRDAAGFFTGPLPFTVKARFLGAPEGGTELVCASAVMDASAFRTGFGQSAPLSFGEAGVSLAPVKPARVKPARQDVFRNLLGRKLRGEGGKNSVVLRKAGDPK